MTNHPHEPLLPLVVSLIGVSVLATACSMLLLPYHTFRWVRRRAARLKRRPATAPAAETWQLRARLS